jgi:N-sulfoglucosamine sulfohydrolase
VQQLLVGTQEQFFDLRSDADERVNLLNDAKHRAELDRLRGLLLTHMERTGDPQLENFRKAVGAKK